MPLFCNIRTTTRRLSACPSAVLSGATCLLVPMAPGARMLVSGMPTLLLQEVGYVVGALSAEFLVQGSRSHRGCISLDLNHVTSYALGFLAPNPAVVVCTAGQS